MLKIGLKPSFLDKNIHLISFGTIDREVLIHNIRSVSIIFGVNLLLSLKKMR